MKDRREIPGAPGYTVDHHLNIYHPKGRRLRPFVAHRGRAKLTVRVNGVSTSRRVADLICLAYHGLPTRAPARVRHLDGDLQNLHPDNLVWEPLLEAYADAIVRRFAHGEPQRCIAADLGSTACAIGRLIRRRAHEHSFVANCKPVPEYPGYYANGKPERYWKVTVRRNGRSTTTRFHRMICAAFHGRTPFDGAHARHLDDDRDNNHPDNLAWGSASDNAYDKARNGRCPVGEKVGNAKLTMRAVVAIRELNRRGYGYKRLARWFGVTQGCIHAVVKRLTWKHVPDPVRRTHRAPPGREAPRSRRRQGSAHPSGTHRRSQSSPVLDP